MAPYLDWFGVQRETLQTVLSALTGHGADNGELYFQYSRTNVIVLEDGIVSQAHSSVDQGVGLRVVVGDQTGFAFTEDLTLEALLGAARVAASIAHGQHDIGPLSFQGRAHHNFYPLSETWADVGIQQKLPLIERVAELAHSHDPAVDKVTVHWVDQDQRVLIADIAGGLHVDRRPMARLNCAIVAERDGQRQSNGANIAGRRGFDWFTEESLQTVARQAVERTMILFDARPPPAGELPVVLSAGASGILLHEAVGHGMEADFNRKGISIYADQMGQKVAPDFVTVVDDGTQPHERGSLNFDDEGTPCERTVLVENGVLRTFLHDSISARHYGLSGSTGSGRRQSFRHTPMPRMRSTYMESGPHEREEIIRAVKRGIMAETFTNGQVHIGAGDYTFYIKNGWLIEDGKVTAPIRDCNIIGNGPDTLREITMVANDSRLDTGGWTCGKGGQSVPVSQGMPTVLVSKLTVGGRNA